MKFAFRKNPHKTSLHRQLPYIVLITVVVVLIGVCIFFGYYGTYIDGILYAERLSQMREVTVQLYAGLDDIIDGQWDIVSTQSNYLMQSAPTNIDELISCINRQYEANGYQEQFVAVDSEGRYYSHDGLHGTLNRLDLFADKPERVSYVHNTMTTGKTKLVFMKKLSAPLTVKNGDKYVTITYYGMHRDVSDFNPYFRCDAYSGNNSVYILDDDGAKVYGNSYNELLKGHNLFKALGNMEYLHNSSFEETLRQFNDNGIVYSNAVLNDAEYYYSLYRMNNSKWILLFIVPSGFVAINTLSLVNTTVWVVLIFAIFMVCVCTAITYIFLHIEQKKAIEIEQRNNAVLAKLNADLEAASKAKSVFLSNMSHDIRTPMNAIVGIAELMDNDINDADRVHWYIQKLQGSSRHLLSLINDILDMSRIEANEVSINSDSLSLAEQIGQVDGIIRFQAMERSQHFEVGVHGIVHEYLIGDGVRLRQIFINLLSNAVKYTQVGGNIRLDIEEIESKTPDCARFIITVTDNGCGMTREFITKIFEPFTRAENSTTNKVQGTGLGMSITKSIVDLMGGQIRVESEVGKGSRFELDLTFPIDRGVNHRIAADKIALVTEDEQLERNVRAALSETNAELTVVSFDDAQKQFHDVDVVLLAGCLNDDCLDEKLSKLRGAANGALIFCCDYVHREHDIDRAINKGAAGVLARPFFVNNLINLINESRSGEQDGVSVTPSVLHGMKFICAEDNELNAEILDEILNMHGASCVICHDGAQLVEVFADIKPGDFDAVLMDIQMPVMNGIDATKAIRNGANPIGKTIPIIAMTANVFTEDVKKCLDAGMNAYVPKPIDIVTLEKIVGKFRKS